jgi:hypothetical protein
MWWRTDRVLCSYLIRQHSANTLISLIAVVGSSLQYGAKWSVIWSVIIIPHASAAPPPRDTVHEPDLRLAFGNRQLATSACYIGA